MLVIGFAILVLIVSVPGRAQDQAAATDLDKPLKQFTIGDLFPKVTSDSTKALGESWKSTASQIQKTASDRITAIESALQAKKAGLAQLKTDLKAADKAKDFVKVGTLEGTIKSDEMTMKVLEQIKKLTATQADFAKSWNDTGAALLKFVDEDNRFDTIRAKAISKPEPGAPDQRLDAAGVQAMKAHATAAKDLGEAFAEVGSKMESIGSSRLNLLSQLEKSGQVQPAK
jgi:hypothetical protein